MNTLPQALKTRRVKETLVTLSQHVERALSLARLEPVQTSEPELSGEPLTPLPKIIDIKPPEIAYQDRAKITMKIKGENLGRVSELYLVRRGEVGPWIAPVFPAAGGHHNDNAANVTVDLETAPHGHYNLLLIDEIGQTALARNVFTIHAPKDPSKASRQRHRKSDSANLKAKGH